MQLESPQPTPPGPAPPGRPPTRSRRTRTPIRFRRRRSRRAAPASLAFEASERSDDMATVAVRYIVKDVDGDEFTCALLGFQEEMHPAPFFAMLSHGDLRLLLSAAGGGPGGGRCAARRHTAGARRLESLPAGDEATSPRPSRSCAERARVSAATSSSGSAASRSWSRTPPAIRSSCSSRPGRRRACRRPELAGAGPACLVDRPGRDDQPDVAEGLREVPELLATGGVDLLRQEARSFA